MPADDTAERLLTLLKRHGAASAMTLADTLGVTPQAVRSQLARLAGEGLVRHEDESRGVGRPKRYWRLAARGHARFPDAHAELTAELIADIRAELGEAALERLVARREQRGRDTYVRALEGIRGLRRRLEKLARLRSAEGYMAGVHETGDGLLLVEDHCPICAAASACQGFCRAELDSFRAALGDDCTVERVEHLPAGGRRCSYLVRPLRR